MSGDIGFKPVTDLSKEVFHNNSKKQVKKSFFYIKLVQKDIDRNDVDLFTEIDFETQQDLSDLEVELKNYAEELEIYNLVELEVSKLAIKSSKYERIQELFNTDEISKTILEADPVNDLLEITEKGKATPNTASSYNPASSINIYDQNEMNQAVKYYAEKYKILFFKFFSAEENRFYIVCDQLVNLDITFDGLKELLKTRHIEFLNSLSCQTDVNQDEDTESPVRSGIKIQIKCKKSKTLNDQGTNKTLEKLGENFKVIVYEETATTFPSYGGEDDIPELNERVLKESLVDGNIIIYTVVPEDSKLSLTKVSDDHNERMVEVYERERSTIWIKLVEKGSKYFTQDVLLDLHIPIRTNTKSLNE
jgi:hypothetical protein